MTCPNCGHTARPELARCGHCNLKLPENPVPQAGPAAPFALIACWNCAKPTPATAERCEHCNAKASTAPQAQEQEELRFNFTQLFASHDE